MFKPIRLYSNIVVLSLALLSTSCTKGIPEFKRLSSTLPSIEFDGSTSKTVVITNLDSPVVVQGKCDKATKSVLISVDDGNSWTDSSTAMPNRVTLTCDTNKQIQFSFLTDNTGLLTFTAGTPIEHKIKVMAKDGVYSANESEILLKYQPLTSPPLAGNLVSPAGSILVGPAKYRLHVRTNHSSSTRAKGSVYKIQSTQ